MICAREDEMARTTITRLRTKASQDRSELDRLLDSIHIGHFASWPRRRLLA
jgi:hypothetical protein